MSDQSYGKIVGDVAVTARIKADRQDGSVGIKIPARMMRQNGLVGRNLSTGTIEFGDGQTIVLISPDRSSDEKIFVKQTGNSSFVLQLGEPSADDDNAEIVVDDAEAAFLRLATKRIGEGKARVGEPLLPSAWDKLMSSKLKRLNRALSR